jgi:aldose 1-epimerase
MKDIQISKEFWGTFQEKEIFLFTLKCEDNSFVEIANLGAGVVGIYVPDVNGHLDNVVLGYTSLNKYVNDPFYMGVTVGRVANRIGNASFMLDDRIVTLERNDGQHTNHGGSSGWHKQIFEYELLEDGVVFYLTSSDGDGGYPGSVSAKVTYRWSKNHDLQIQYHATVDAPTVLNITNHAYFNLHPTSRNIDEHIISINASKWLPSTDAYIPTGEIRDVSKKLPKSVLREFELDDSLTNKLNTYFIKEVQDDIPIATLFEPISKRMLEVFTDYPGVQVYTGDYLTHPFNSREGICLECQHYPDSPNHILFPSIRLSKDEIYNQTICYRFSIKS